MSRNLLNRSYEVLGLDQKLWLSLETGGYGDAATGGLIPASGGAVEHINFGMKFDIPREDSAARSGRSLVTRLSGKKTAEMNFEGYIIPGTPDISGNPTLPPIHALILSAFGKVNLTNPAEIKYQLSKLNANSFRVLEEATHYSRVAVGCVVDKLTFSLPGDGKATVKAEGFAQDVYAAGETEVAQPLTGLAQKASKVIQDLTYEAVAAGQPGNGITIQYTGGATAGAEVVTVVGNAITVQIETTQSTANQISAAVIASGPASALVTPTVSGTGTNAQVIAAAVNLVGGLGVNDVRVTDDRGQLFEIDSLIDIISATDGNTLIAGPRKVVAINGDILTVDGAALPVTPAGAFILGHAPATYSPISSENALLGLKGTFTVAGYPIGACELITAEIGLTNNFTKKDFIFGTSKICGYLPDKRRGVSVKVDILLNKENFGFYMRNKKFIAEDLTITLEPQDIPAPSFSTSTGRTFEFKMPRVEFNIPAIEQPADKYVTLSLEGVAMANSLDDLDSELVLTIK